MTESTKPFLLIVEDDPSTLAALERLFRTQFHVLKCQTAAEAFQTLNSYPEIAIILSDYQLPNMSGLELFEKIQTSHPSVIKIILTGVLDAEELSSAMNRGLLHRVFRKPWENDFLLLQMNEALQQHRTLLERQKFEELSVTDPITGLFNQRHFQNHLSIEIDRAKRHQRIISLVMADIDSFKKMNDEKGHIEGNKLLQAIALALKDNVRNIDLVFRYAGDEFAILLPDTPKEGAKDVAERVRTHIEKQKLGATLSLGVATYPEDSSSSEELIQKADQALYLAKRNGKNQTVIAGQR